MAAAGATPAAPTTTEFVGQDRRELRLPVTDSSMAEYETALKKHLG
jgi:hypothetical protein